LGIAHVSTGDMFREAAASGTALGTRAKSYMDRGELVPDEVTLGMLGERLKQQDAQGGAIFDGFPRTQPQAAALDESLAKQGKSVNIALHITASDDEVVRRLSGRWLCPNCGEIYQEASRPPRQPGLCDACGASLTQREDDRAEVVRQRLEKQRPARDLLNHYRGQTKLVDIDGEQGVEAVTKQLADAIRNSTQEPAKS